MKCRLKFIAKCQIRDFQARRAILNHHLLQLQLQLQLLPAIIHQGFPLLHHQKQIQNQSPYFQQKISPCYKNFIMPIIQLLLSKQVLMVQGQLFH